MNFQIGGECLCIKTHSGKGTIFDVPPSYIKGTKYPVLGLKTGCSHHPLLIDIGIPAYGRETVCLKCKTIFRGDWYDAANFVPIDNTLSDTTIEEILENIDNSVKIQ